MEQDDLEAAAKNRKRIEDQLHLKNKGRGIMHKRVYTSRRTPKKPLKQDKES